MEGSLINIFQKICKDTIDFLKENGSVSLEEYRSKILELCEEHIPYPIRNGYNVLDTFMSALNITRRVSIDYEDNGIVPMSRAKGRVKFEKDLDKKFWLNTKSYENQLKNIFSGKTPYGGKLKK